MLSGGIYHNLEHRPPHPGRILNTWVGDPHKIIMLEQVVKTIKEESLLNLVTESGKTIIEGLEDIQSRYPEILSKARGRGTICAVDVKKCGTQRQNSHNTPSERSSPGGMWRICYPH